jgi:hypothetical protein
VSDPWQMKGSTIVKNLALLLIFFAALYAVIVAGGAIGVILCFAIFWYYWNKYKDHRSGPRRGLAPGIASPWLRAFYFVAAVALALLALLTRLQGLAALLLFLVVCRYYWIYART